MSLPDELAGLLGAEAYPHPSETPTLIETHISWILLTGTFAYKLKKPVHFDFVDFSTLERRGHFCREELRCNRAFAPSLYLDVVAVVRDEQGRVRMGGDGEVLEWAVRMRQFPSHCQLDRRLAAGALEPGVLREFGASLAAVHAIAPSMRCGADELDVRVLDPMRDNFAALQALTGSVADHQHLAELRTRSEGDAQELQPLLESRLREGWIRECHGDLHLGNLVLLGESVVAFDCLEFNPDLRWIDPQSDVAFLYMDCLVRGRTDLGYAFLDGYLNVAGDYSGVRLLPFYALYRAMVRAKVAALRESQRAAEQTRQSAATPAPSARAYLAWMDSRLSRQAGALVLMCGLSGSGKSYLAERLAPRLPAVRLRSDVARKVAAGLAVDASAASSVGEGLYRSEVTAAVYDHLAEVAVELLRRGEHVIVDATFLDGERRRRFLALAETVGSQATVLWCDAPLAVLRKRVEARAAAGGAASDADLAVLESQRRKFQAPAEKVLRVDSGAEFDDRALAEIGRSLVRGR
jgi:uncharacterized protein